MAARAAPCAALPLPRRPARLSLPLRHRAAYGDAQVPEHPRSTHLAFRDSIIAGAAGSNGIRRAGGPQVAERALQGRIVPARRNEVSGRGAGAPISAAQRLAAGRAITAALTCAPRRVASPPAPGDTYTLRVLLPHVPRGATWPNPPPGTPQRRTADAARAPATWRPAAQQPARRQSRPPDPPSPPDSPPACPPPPPSGARSCSPAASGRAGRRGGRMGQG